MSNNLLGEVLGISKVLYMMYRGNALIRGDVYGLLYMVCNGNAFIGGSLSNVKYYALMKISLKSKFSKGT